MEIPLPGILTYIKYMQVKNYGDPFTQDPNIH